MRKLFAAVALLMVAYGASAETVSTVVDYVALNGNSSKGLFAETTKAIDFAYNEETQTWEGRQTTDAKAFESDSTIVDFDGKEKVLKVVSVWCKPDVWHGPCVEYAIDSGVPLKNAQSVSFPYYYVPTPVGATLKTLSSGLSSRPAESRFRSIRLKRFRPASGMSSRSSCPTPLPSVRRRMRIARTAILTG